MSNEEAAVRDVVERWVQRLCGARISRPYWPIDSQRHADVRYVPPPFYSKGIDDYRATWDIFYSSATDPVVFDIEEMDVTAGADVAFAAAFMSCRYIYKGTPTDLAFRLTVGLRKIAGQWTITHEHHSVPATD